ncbi:hypothetical protein PRK78_005839 [Emydomyces testavorans]|uniref:Uncharacterized protein n=1 Tax=Emydomyces testavorans TaxID=2070801 RepID=A0AAF0DKC4_9EURO|nr:hypothetical protein PRK78_005839 [Emydomyces testavorans]
MTSILHTCPYCGYETEIASVLPAFAENPPCQRCGLSGTEGDSKVDSDLATLFARQMAMGHVPQNPIPEHPTTPPTPNLSNPPGIPNASPITYSITQHYHHSSHQALTGPRKLNLDTQGQRSFPEEGSSAKEMLLRHNINPDSLFPSQLTLFEQADPEQKARLVELWQISPPAFGNPSSLRPFTDSLAGSGQSSRIAQVAEAHNDIVMDEDNTDAHDPHTAEPYVVSGYEILARKEYDSSAQQQTESPHPSETLPTEPASNDAYKTSTDPAYRREDWWQNSQPVEHQYGAFEMKNYYIGCGVAIPHWLEDQHMF